MGDHYKRSRIPPGATLRHKLMRMDELMAELSELYDSIQLDLRKDDPSLGIRKRSTPLSPFTPGPERGALGIQRAQTDRISRLKNMTLPPPPEGGEKPRKSMPVAGYSRMDSFDTGTGTGLSAPLGGHTRSRSHAGGAGIESPKRGPIALWDRSSSVGLVPEDGLTLGHEPSDMEGRPSRGGAGFSSAIRAFNPRKSMEGGAPPPPGGPPPAHRDHIRKMSASMGVLPTVGGLRSGFTTPATGGGVGRTSHRPGESGTDFPSIPEMRTGGRSPGAPPLEKVRKKKKTGLPDDGMTERDFFKKYWIEAGKLGEGAFSRVRKITRKADKATFALKVVKKKGKAKEDIIALQKEIYVLQKCDHPNIVKLLDWCDTKKRIYMVVDFCDGGDVFERVVAEKKFSEADAAKVISQVAAALSELHSKKFVHRDLKPDNLMYVTKDQDSPIKVIDLGLAGDFNGGPCTTPCGTAHYAAPEVLAGAPYDAQSDIWSLGVITYTLLCGFPPFFDTNNDMKNLYHLIKKAKFSFPSPFWDEISEGAKDFIRACLNKDSRSRLTAMQVLEHSWVSGGAPDTCAAFTEEYMAQMQQWQSQRHETERQIGAPAMSSSLPVYSHGPAPYRPGAIADSATPYRASAVM